MTEPVRHALNMAQLAQPVDQKVDAPIVVEAIGKLERNVINLYGDKKSNL